MCMVDTRDLLIDLERYERTTFDQLVKMELGALKFLHKNGTLTRRRLDDIHMPSYSYPIMHVVYQNVGYARVHFSHLTRAQSEQLVVHIITEYKGSVPIVRYKQKTGTDLWEIKVTDPLTTSIATHLRNMYEQRFIRGIQAQETFYAAAFRSEVLSQFTVFADLANATDLANSHREVTKYKFAPLETCEKGSSCDKCIIAQQPLPVCQTTALGDSMPPLEDDKITNMVTAPQHSDPVVPVPDLSVPAYPIPIIIGVGKCSKTVSISPDIAGQGTAPNISTGSNMPSSTALVATAPVPFSFAFPSITTEGKIVNGDTPSVQKTAPDTTADNAVVSHNDTLTYRMMQKMSKQRAANRNASLKTQNK